MAEPTTPALKLQTVHHPRLLDTIFALAVAMMVSQFVVVIGAGVPWQYMALGGVGLLIAGVLWIAWRSRRRRGRRSFAVAVALAVPSVGLFLLSNSLSSLALQWVAVLVLTLEIGLVASIAYSAAIATLTFVIHTFVGTGLSQGLIEAIGVAFLLAVGVEFAALLHRAERLDAQRSAALAEAEQSGRALAQANDELARANAELTRANVELERANEQQRRQHGREQGLVLAEERARIATALHDGLGHRLTAIGMSLDFSDRMHVKDPERAAAEVRNARATASASLDEMRRVVRAMHPVVTDAGDVAGSLEALAGSFTATGLDVSFARSGSAPIGVDQGLLLLRFAQESLTNVVRHADATRTELQLEQGDDAVRLEVRDDGAAPVGNPGAQPGPEGRIIAGFGIRSMHERAESLGGRVAVRPRGGLERSDGSGARGFAIELTLPAEAAERAPSAAAPEADAGPESDATESSRVDAATNRERGAA